jgi:2-methylcitrate dehydratase PrpD
VTTATPPLTSTASLATFVADAAPSDAAFAAARRALATVLPLAAAGADDAPATALLEVLDLMSDDTSIPVVGTEHRLPPALAAMAIGTAANTPDFDDTDPQTLVHPAPAVVPAAWVLAVANDRPAEALLRAIAIGTEVAVRTGRSFGAQHAARGWHPSATAGSLGAAAAAAAVVDLGVEEIAQVLGLAATQAAGLGVALGTMVKPLHFGRAAAAGVEAVGLVRAGLSAPRDGVTGRRGLVAVMAPDADLDVLFDGLGDRWLGTEVEPKPYPCGVVAHPVVAAARQLHRPGETEVDEVQLHVHPDVLRFMDRPRPTTPLEAKLSVAHCAAVALVSGELPLLAFHPDALADRAVVAVRDRISVTAREDTRRAATVRVRRRGDWEQVTVTADEVPALDNEGVAAKGVAVATPSLGAERARALVAACLGSTRHTVAELAELTVPAT